MIVTETRMDSDSFSCIRVISKKVPITLSTDYQANEIIGISNVLDSWKRQYIQQLQGIVVSYKYVSLISKHAYIKRDAPIIHCDVKATFELFTPIIGSIVKGKINRISHDYIGCLVHNTINVAIDRSGSECDSVSHFIALDQIILFEITHIGFKRKIVRVKGKITKECINLMKNMDLSNVETVSTNHNQLTKFSDSSNEDTAGEDCRNNFDEEVEDGNQSQSLLCDSADLLDGNLKHVSAASTEKKKKKKLKEFHTEQSMYKSFGNLDMENEDMSQSLLCNNTRLFEKESSDVSHDSSKKEKKKSDRSKKKLNNDMSFDSVEVKSEDETLSSLSYESAEFCGKYSVHADSHSKRRKKKVSGSPSLFSDSSNKDEPEPFKIPRSPSKIRLKLSQDEFSTTEVTPIVDDFTSPFHDKDNVLSTPLSTSISLPKASVKTDDFDNLLDVLSSYDPSLGDQLHNEVLLKNVNEKSLNKKKKGKKRKHESPEKDGLPKKKKKIEGKDSVPKKTSSKHKPIKTKKKSKEKSEKDSKKSKEKSEKDSKKGKKKKPKIKVISSKKKLPKLKKEKRTKDEKLKKKLKKAKNKDNVP